MSLLDTASLILTPNGYKASKLYSVKPTDASGDMVVTRATTATRVNSAGLIESVDINVPRLDYTGGGCPSILSEPARTNLVFPSATLTTQTRTVTAVANTLSFYGTGTIVLTGVHTATLTGTGANNRVSLTFTPIAGSLILTVTGTVTNAQLEAGSNATSYIPTVAGTVTRTADSSNTTGLSSLIGQLEGTIYAEILVKQITQDYLICALSLTGQSVTNSVVLTVNNIGKLVAQVYASSVSIVNPTAFVVGDIYKVAFGYKSGNSVMFVNGGQVSTTDTDVFNLTTLNAVSLVNSGYYVTGGQQAVKSIVLFKTRLTNAQLATLTTL